MSSHIHTSLRAHVSFDCPQEEAAHYREKYRRILDMLDETRAELGLFGGKAIRPRMGWLTIR